MLNENQKLIIKLRLDQAAECIRDARIMLDSGSYKSAANRSYYSIFHAMRAVLVVDSIDFKKHSGIISSFRERYIKTNIFPSFFSDYIRQASYNRNNSDYEDFFCITKDEAAVQIENAITFYNAIEIYIKTLQST